MPPAGSSRGGTAAASSDRRQSARQGRANVARPQNYYARSFPYNPFGPALTDDAGAPTNTHPDIFPALTHFTQAVDAFPKELIKHFSMFKEVEAKIHDPERTLGILLDEIAKLPVPTREESKAKQGDNSTNASVNGSVGDASARPQQQAAPSYELFPADFEHLPAEEKAELRKRQLFFRLRMTIVSMLPTLDEKLVVLTSAKAAKDKCLARMSSSYAHMDEEISEESRYGNDHHWAYVDNREERKKGGTTHERQRREVASANNLAAAAQAVHDADSIAAKSEARREAVMAKRNRNNQHVDSDFDDPKPAKKTQKRKAPADNSTPDSRAVGLGITGSGAPQAGKRKKTEKAAAAAAAAAAAPAMERSLSGALQAAAAGGRSGASPRATPTAENGGKRKAKAAPAGPGRKRGGGTIGAPSPSLVSSPLVSNFTIREVATAAQRPTSSRARKNSTANSVISAVPEPAITRRPSSSQSNLPTNNGNVIAELEQAAGMAANPVPNDSAPTAEAADPKPPETSDLKHEEPEPEQPETMEIDETVTTSTTATARAGRSSKTATPVAGSFPDVPMVRSRSTRNANNNGGGTNTPSENNSTSTTTKRGHKKSISTHNAVATGSPAVKPTTANKNTNQSAKSSAASSPEAADADPEASLSDEFDDDGNEPRYCYCNEVSYGNMIACDNPECPREWFHLACVNMEKAPNSRTKWWCSDACKEIYLRKGKGGRPGTGSTGTGAGSGDRGGGAGDRGEKGERSGGTGGGGGGGGGGKQ